jgi:hypothetical protein
MLSSDSTIEYREGGHAKRRSLTNMVDRKVFLMKSNSSSC